MAERTTETGGQDVVWAVAVLALQIGASVFFVADALSDLASDGFGVHAVAEGIIALGLAAGVATGLLYLRRVLRDRVRERATNAAARGAFDAMVRARFAAWGLTAAETDVAFFALKGFDTGEIARLRSAAEGTVRAQLAKIYSKAGVTSRTGLVSLFVDDLLDGAVARHATSPQSHTS